MFSDDSLKQLRSACGLYGGIMAVANQAGVDDGNLSRWLRGKGTLSDEKVSRVLNVMGLPNGEPARDVVHCWAVKRMQHDYPLSLSPYFPNGADIARAQWSESGLKANLKRLKTLPWVPELYALTDGSTRAILRLPTGLLLQKKQLGGKVRWKEGSVKESVLHIPDRDLPTWLEKTPSISQFDQAWQGQAAALGEKDVIQAIQDEGISFEKAISRIRRTK